jgi:hypothetical protein
VNCLKEIQMSHVRRLFILLTILFALRSEAVNDSTRRKICFDLGLAVIINNSISHYALRFPPFVYQYRSFINQDFVKPGAGISFGIRWRKCGLYLQAGLSRTQAEYHVRDTVHEDSNIPWARIARRNYNVQICATYLNLEIGARERIFGPFFIAAAFGCNVNLETFQKETGQKEIYEYLTGSVSPSIYFSNPGYRNPRTSSEVMNNTTKTRSRTAFSNRLSAIYQFPGNRWSVLVFRNFCFNYKLPWWGAGVTLTL